MRLYLVVAVCVLWIAGCGEWREVDRTPPAIPQGIRTVSLDNAVQIDWLPNQEPDLAGYNVWVSGTLEGRYTLIASVEQNTFLDVSARNGQTSYYALSAYDFAGNESELSREVVYDTPRPEGLNVRIYDIRVAPNLAGYDFSTYSVGRYDDDYTDLFFEVAAGRALLQVWSDTDIQDMGYTGTLDDISSAPSSGWSPSGSAEAIEGHTYVIWTWDNHFAKVRLKEVTSSSVVFDWAYQTAEGNPELKKSTPTGGRLPLVRRSGPAL
jgi:hypothetical protein